MMTSLYRNGYYIVSALIFSACESDSICWLIDCRVQSQYAFVVS